MKYNFKKILFLNFLVLGFFACPVSFCGVFGAEEARAATYYVSYDSGNYYYRDGSIGTALENDGSAIDLDSLIAALSGSGNTIVLIAGTYVDLDATDGVDVTIGSFTLRGMLPDDPNYETYGGEVVIDGSAIGDWVFRINDCSNVVLSHLSIIGNYTYGAIGNIGTASNNLYEYLSITGNTTASNYSMYIAGDSGGDPSNIEVSHCTFTIESQPTRGLVILNADTGSGNSVHDCVITNTSGIVPRDTNNNGIYLSSSNNWSIYSNHIGDETNRLAVGILIRNSNSNNIYQNTIQWCLNGSSYPDDFGHGIQIEGSSEANNVFKNYIYKASRVGILLNSTSGNGENFIGSNLIVDSIVNGISHESNANGNPDKIWNNTIIHRPEGYAGHGLAVQINGIKADIKNNIVYAYTTYSGGGFNVQAVSITDDANPNEYNVYLNNNLYFRNGTAKIAKNENGSYNTLTGWQVSIADDVGISGKDANSIANDPLFQDLDGRNFTLAVLSPAIDSGTDVGLTTDYAGNPIYGTPDIGVYEYQPPHTIGNDKIDIGAGARIYGDGKFRDKEITSSDLADLTITPESGNFETYESDEVRPEWMDIKNITWENTKEWTESSSDSTLTNTLHTIGDLEANKYYNVSVDNTLGENIEGENCISGICRSNSEGKISFTYTGTYSEHTFRVEAGDNTPPAVTSGTTLKFPTDTKEVTLSITTNENSTCKYSVDESDEYDNMTAFETTGEKTHSTMYQAVHGAAIYKVYAICKDTVGNNISYTLTFEIAKEKEDSKISNTKSDNLTLDENKKIYLEEDRTKLKGEDQSIANGKVKIYKNGKIYKEVDIDENGKWSKKISFDHDRNYTIKIEFFDEFGTLRDEKEYKIKVDTEKPVFQNEEGNSSVNKDERISFPAEDEETKIDHYKIKVLDKNGQIIRKWKKQKEDFYEIPEKIKDEAKTVIVRAYDKAGNKSELRFEVGPRKALPRGGAPAQLPVTGSAEEVQEVMDEKEELQESSPEPTTGNNPPETKTEIQPTASEVPENNSPASKSKWWNPFSWF